MLLRFLVTAARRCHIFNLDRLESKIDRYNMEVSEYSEEKIKGWTWNYKLECLALLSKASNNDFLVAVLLPSG